MYLTDEDKAILELLRRARFLSIVVEGINIDTIFLPTN